VLQTSYIKHGLSKPLWWVCMFTVVLTTQSKVVK